MRDEDLGKGAVEQDAPGQSGNENFSGQMPHRNPAPMASGQDTDFPEPGENPEHSGQQISNRPDRPLTTPRGETSDTRGMENQEPGHTQERNQGGEKDDPLAA